MPHQHSPVFEIGVPRGDVTAVAPVLEEEIFVRVVGLQQQPLVFSQRFERIFALPVDHLVVEPAEHQSLHGVEVDRDDPAVERSVTVDREASQAARIIVREP